MTKICVILHKKEIMSNGKYAKTVRCYCGKVMKLSGLSSHLHYKHNLKRNEVTLQTITGIQI